MNKWGNSKVLTGLLILALIFSVVPTLPGTNTYAATTTDDAPWVLVQPDFILPVDSLTEVPDGYVGITTVEELQAISSDLDGKYILMNAISIPGNTAPNFEPIGTSAADAFTGVLDGNGYTISGLRQNIISTELAYGGLFGYIVGGEVKNLGMESVSVVTTYAASCIAGYVSESTISNCYATGYVNARPIAQAKQSNGYAGGIVGQAKDSTLTNCFSTARTNAVAMTYNNDTQSTAGGVAGFANGTIISKCFNAAYVNSSVALLADTGGGSSSQANTGGILGSGYNTTISECYNTGKIEAYIGNLDSTDYWVYSSCRAGGIVGELTDSIASDPDISNCYNTGDISATCPYKTGTFSIAGGIVGYPETKLDIDCCYNMGSVVASDTYHSDIYNEVSGLASFAYREPVITKTNSGYPIGDPRNTVATNCYYLDIVYSGDPVALTNQTKLTERQMIQQSSFAGFDFNKVWQIGISSNYPYPNLQTNPYASNPYYLVTYDTRGGTPINSRYVTYYTRLSEPPTPKRNGYTFGGWYADSAYATPWDFIGNRIMKDTTLYAKWNAPITSAVSYNYTSAKISWAAADGATSYRIYRANSATGTYYLVHVADSTARSYVNTGLVTGKTYYYKVSVVAGGKTYHHSAYKEVKVIPSTPKVTLSKASSTSIKVTWTGVSGATVYQIFRATSATGYYTYQHSSSSTTRSWTATGLTPGKTYYYKVRAYHLEGRVKVYGNLSTEKYLAL